MKKASTYIGWGDEPLWTIEEGIATPHLIWENIPGEIITTPSYGGGDGSREDPFLIHNTDQFLAIGDRPFNWDKCFKLMGDISLAGLDSTSLNIIGYYYKAPFTGIFDGQAFAITGFSYHISKRIHASQPSNIIGVFGHIDDPNAEVCNVNVVSPYVAVNLEDGADSYASVGALAGRLSHGSVANCSVSGGTVYIDGDYVGGLIGRNYYGDISGCHSSALVRCKMYGNTEAAGGLTGASGGKILESAATGQVIGNGTAGGLLGSLDSEGHVNRCHATGEVSGGGDVGGLIGRAYVSAEITRSYASGEISSSGSYSDAGGLVGRNAAAVVECYAEGEVSAQSSDAVGGLAGLNENTGKILRCEAFGRVFTLWTEVTGGLVGVNHGEAKNSLATGKVSGASNSTGGLVGKNFGEIMCCYSTGDVYGYGGLVGENESGQVLDSFWDIQTSGRTTSAGGTGLTTAEMQDPQTFLDAGWDFIEEGQNGRYDIWRLCNAGLEYPRLSWYYPHADFTCPDGVGASELTKVTEQWLLCELLSEESVDSVGQMDFTDLAAFALSWQSTTGSSNWNSACDIAPEGGDGKVDVEDMVLLCQSWLEKGAYYLNADISPKPDGDGIVDFLDFAEVADNWLGW
jgi:hypothetical protein